MTRTPDYNPTTEMYEKFAGYGFLQGETDIVCDAVGMERGCDLNDLDAEVIENAELSPEAKRRLLKLVDDHINEDEHLLRNMIAALAWWDDSSQQPWRT